MAESVSGIEVLIHFHSVLLKMLYTIFRRSIKQCVPFRKKNYPIEGKENFGLRLVNGAN